MFSYESDLNAFGGTQNNEKVHIVGTVGLGCTQKWKNEKGDDVYLMVLQVRDMDIKMENHEQVNICVKTFSDNLGNNTIGSWRRVSSKFS